MGLACAVIGCGNKETDAPKSALTVIEKTEYELAGKIGESLGLLNPSSILWNSDELYISDTDHDRIVVSDANGNLIRTIGQAGNGPLEFIKPTGLTMDNENNLYVVDSGNNRVQVINKQGQLVKLLSIKNFPFDGNSSRLTDIALQNGLQGTIYVGSKTLDKKWAKVYAVEDNGNVKTYGSGVIGQLANVNGDVIFVTEGELKKEKDGRSFESGRNYMYHIGQSGLEGETELPYKYTAGDMQSKGSDLYVLSRAYGTIDHFDTSGNYKTTAFRFQLPMEEARGIKAMALGENDIFVLNEKTNLIYYLKDLRT